MNSFFEGIISLVDLQKLSDADSAVVVCNTIDMPHVKNVSIKHCNLCGQAVWFADSTMKKVAEKPSATIYLTCTDCFRHLNDTEVGMITEEQLHELAQETGMPIDDIRERIADFVRMHNIASKYQAN